jgi:RNA polymerase sigma-70 factor (ECF subfamily)
MDSSEVEAGVLRRIEAQDVAGAATLAIRGLGPAVLGYLTAVLRSETDASDAFSMFCEDLWRGIASFRGESKFRTWAYTLAWHAALRLLRDPHRKRGRALGTGEAEKLAAEVRTTTAAHFKTESKDALAEMRAQLAPDEQSLLVLRIDRGLSWGEIAEVLGEGKGAKAEAALRKRFERLKEKLRKEAVARGLLKE